MIDLQSALHANHAIVPLIYEAAVSPERWDDAMVASGEFLESDYGMLSISYRASQKGEIVARTGFSADFVETWERKYAHNEWVELAFALPPGELIHAAETVSVDQMLDTPMGAELIAPLGFRDGFGLGLSDSPLFAAVISYYAHQPYRPAVLDRLPFLAPHFARSLALHQRMIALQSRSTAFERSLDQLAAGIVLLDRNARCLHANTMAREILHADDGVALRDGVVTLARPQDRAALAGAIDQALEATPSGAARGLFRIARRSEGRAYHAVVSPAVTALVDPGSAEAVLLWITDPDGGVSPSEESIATLLDLTPSEARIASAISSGRTVREYAVEAGVTEGTARWTLKQVLAKTGVGSQSELTRLILASLPSPPF